jgi:hypothetical protein
MLERPLLVPLPILLSRQTLMLRLPPVPQQILLNRLLVLLLILLSRQTLTLRLLLVHLQTFMSRVSVLQPITFLLLLLLRKWLTVLQL